MIFQKLSEIKGMKLGSLLTDQRLRRFTRGSVWWLVGFGRGPKPTSHHTLPLVSSEAARVLNSYRYHQGGVYEKARWREVV